MNKQSRYELTTKLERVLATQDRLHGAVRDEAQHANLIYALKEIRPGSHTEFALVVWAGTRHVPVHEIIEEYCLRRADESPGVCFYNPHDITDKYCRHRVGRSSRLFDHPLLSLHGWCMPDTYRLLVFREQLEALAKQLTGNRDGRDIVWRINQYEKSIKGISPMEFRKLIDPVNGLTAADVTLFYDYIRERYAASLPYVWCSTIVELALCQSGKRAMNSLKD